MSLLSVNASVPRYRDLRQDTRRILRWACRGPVAVDRSELSMLSTSSRRPRRQDDQDGHDSLAPVTTSVVCHPVFTVFARAWLGGCSSRLFSQSEPPLAGVAEAPCPLPPVWSPSDTMLPTRSIKHPPQRKNKGYGRRPPTMTRSGSILSTIRNIVTAPLSWFAGNEEFEDINGKRRRAVGIDAPPNIVAEGSKQKRMRVDSPPMATGYLDPPQTSFQSFLQPPQRKETDSIDQRSNHSQTSYNKWRPSPLSVTRTMSIDPPTRSATFTHDSARITLPHDSVVHTRNSMSVSRDLSLPPPTPFRMRTSLTPQPSPTKSVRREASAPPPLATLMSNPIFVKPPPEPTSSRKLDEQKTMSLGSLTEFHRMVRVAQIQPSNTVLILY